MYRNDHTPPVRPNARAGTLLLLCMTAIGVSQTACERPRDPVEILKGFIPQVERALNRHDLSALQSMGTSRLDARQLITDLCGSDVSDTVSLRFMRVIFPRPTEAQLSLRMSKMTPTGQVDRLVEIHFTEDGKWRIDGYSIPSPRPDSTGTGGG